MNDDELKEYLLMHIREIARMRLETQPGQEKRFLLIKVPRSASDPLTAEYSMTGRDERWDALGIDYVAMPTLTIKDLPATERMEYDEGTGTWRDGVTGKEVGEDELMYRAMEAATGQTVVYVIAMFEGRVL